MPDLTTGGVLTRVDRTPDTVGDGTGTKNANVNGATTAVVFKINLPSTRWINLARMIVEVRDAGQFSAERYGFIANGLTNGIQVGRFLTADDSLSVDYLDGLPVKHNAAWGRHCYDTTLRTWGAGDQFLHARWTFSRAGIFTHMRSTDASYFGVKIRDDCTGLVEHYFTVQGYSRS